MTFLSWKSLRFGQLVKRSPSNLFSSTLGGLPDFVKFTLAAKVPQNAYINTSLPRWNRKSLTLASNPAQSTLYATLPAKVNLRKLRGSAIRLRAMQLVKTLFSLPKHYKGGPVRGGVFASSEETSVRHNRPFTGWNDIPTSESRHKTNWPKRNVRSTQGLSPPDPKSHFVSVSVMTRSLRSDSRFATVLRRSEMVCWRLSIVELI